MRATFTATSTTDERHYTCPSCGYEAEAEITGFGEGAQSSLNPDGTAGRRADQDARRDLDRVYSLATCPCCGFRD